MKQTIQSYLNNGDIETALVELRGYAIAQKDNELQNNLILLQARFAVMTRKEIARTEKPEDLQLERNRLTESLNLLATGLPDDPKDKNGKPLTKPKGIAEKRLKQHIFLLILIAKISIMLLMAFHRSTAGLSSQEFAAGCGLLLPILAAYTGLMFQEFLAQRHILYNSKSPYVKNSVQWAIYGLMLCYTFALWIVVYLKTKYGSPSLTAGFATVETLFGVYISSIIHTFFQKNQQ